MTARDDSATPAEPWLVAGQGWSRRSSLLLVAGVVAQGIFHFIGYFPRRRPFHGDELMYWKWGLRIANGESFEPNLVWPPGQARFLATMFDVFGESRRPIQILQTIIFLAAGLLIRRLALRIGRSALAA